MNQYRTISDLKDNAKEHLTGKFSSAVVMNLLPGLFTFSITFIFTMFTNAISTLALLMQNPASVQDAMMATDSFGLSFATYLFSQVLAIFTGVFSTGIALYFLNVACGRTALISNLFYGFQYMFKKSMTISSVMVLVNVVCLMPYNVCFLVYQSNGSTLWLLYTAVTMTVGMIIYTPISLSLSQSYFLLLDFPSYSAKELLRLSMRVMKGRKRKLFLIELSFIPLLILSTMTFGIGDLWLTPYMNMTMALYFLDIMKPSAKPAEMPSETPTYIPSEASTEVPAETPVE